MGIVAGINAPMLRASNGHSCVKDHTALQSAVPAEVCRACEICMPTLKSLYLYI